MLILLKRCNSNIKELHPFSIDLSHNWSGSNPHSLWLSSFLGASSQTLCSGSSYQFYLPTSLDFLFLSHHFHFLYLVVQTFNTLSLNYRSCLLADLPACSFLSQLIKPLSVLYSVSLILSCVSTQSLQCLPLVHIPIPEEGWVVGYSPTASPSLQFEAQLSGPPIVMS